VADANKVINILKANIAELTLQVAILKVELEEQQERAANDLGLVSLANVEDE